MDRMKNAAIVILILAVGALCYFLVVKNIGTNEITPNSTSPEKTTNTPKSNGKSTDLSGKGISQVPKDILDDSSVTTFNVSNNNLTGALPAEIRKLTNLEVLIASDNNMTGIPAEIGQISKLRIANFANNDLSGLPQEIGKLKSLETLDLRGNPNISRQDLSKIQSEIPNAKILTD